MEEISKIQDIEYLGEVVLGQEDLPFSQRKYIHPETKEHTTYSTYMKFVEEGKALHPEVLFSKRIKYTLSVQKPNGDVIYYKYDERKNSNGPYEVETEFADDGNEEWRQYEPSNLKSIEGQENMPLSKRKYLEPYTGDEISYSVYMRHVREDETVPHPMELDNPLLVRNPKKLRANQKDLPNSKQLYIHPEGVQEFGYIGYGTYMKLVNDGKAIHPDKI